MGGGASHPAPGPTGAVTGSPRRPHVGPTGVDAGPVASNVVARPPHPGMIRVARLPWSTDRNPYQRVLYRALTDHGVELVGTGDLDPTWLRANAGRVDVLHVHWRLDRLADDPATVEPNLALARSLGYRVVWTVHEPQRLHRPDTPAVASISAAVAHRADAVLVHGPAAAALVRRWWSQVAPTRGPLALVSMALGPYHELHGPSPGRLPSPVAALPDDVPMLLSFGHQRPDKDLALLFRAFATTPNAGARLVIAGAFEPPVLATALAAARRDDRIVIVHGHVADEVVVGLHSRATASVLARSVDWTSSSVALAASLHVPVVAADLPTTRDLVGPSGAAWFTPGNHRSLAAALRRVVDDPVGAADRAARAHEWVTGRSWADVAAATAAVLRRVTLSDPSTDHVGASRDSVAPSAMQPDALIAVR